MQRQAMQIPVTGRAIAATLAMPPSAPGLVMVAQCGGSPRNTDMAALLEQRGLATVLVDLHCSGDEDDGIDVVADRVIAAIDHLRATNLHHGLPIALLGATLAGTAALIATARRTDLVTSVVCWSARLDLVGPRLAAVRTPTLLVAGSQDTGTLRAMRDAARQMIAPHRVAVISGATERFDEPGALEEVAAAASTWLLGYLRAARPALLATAR
jgi:putative phosphoribosyl transferase